MSREMKQVGLPWLKEVPASWQVTRLKFFASTVNGFSVNDRDKDNYLKQGPSYIPYIMTMDLDKETQSIKHKSKLFSAKDDPNFNIPPKGSVLTLLMGGNSGKKSVLVKEDISFGRALIAIVPNQKYLNSSFLHYILTSKFYEYYVDSNQDTFTRYIRTTKIMDFSFPFPSLQEQEKIAAYLDGRIPTISKLIITEKKRIVKHKQLMHALHRNLIFNEDAELIDTVFNGDIKLAASKGYSLSKIKYVFKKVREAATEEDPIIVCGCNGKAYFRGNKKVSYDTDNLNVFQKVKKNQLIFNGMSIDKGAVSISEYNGRCSDKNHCLEFINNNNFDLRYFYYFFRATSFLNLYRPFSVGVRTGSVNFSWNRAGELPLLYPSPAKQKEIADKLDKAVAGIEKEIAEAQDLISKLTTLRASLIEEALTGKIDVSNLDLEQLQAKIKTLDTDTNSEENLDLAEELNDEDLELEDSED